MFLNFFFFLLLSLLVVSTKVGGIPEVLPSQDTQSDIMILCEPNIDRVYIMHKHTHTYIYIYVMNNFVFYLDVFNGLCKAIDRIRLGQIPDANQWHDKIKHWYSWFWVAKHTECVYNHINTQKSFHLKERIEKFV